jgi:predicted site-specific integrase-resolvase
MSCLFLSYKQLAERWGYAVQTLREWKMQGRLPGAIKIGGGVRFPIGYVLEVEAKGVPAFNAR